MTDLKLRTFLFAQNIHNYCKTVKSSILTDSYVRQIIRSSSSVGANYLESVDHLGQKDSLMRLKIVRKEIKETYFWLELLEGYGDSLRRNQLVDEANQLLKIFSAIINSKSKITF